MFTRSQRNGLIVLGILIILSLLSPMFLKFFTKDYSSSFAAFEKEIDLAKKAQKSKPIELFVFNPNTATKTDFKLLGLSPKQVKQIINFREKVTEFKIKKDFAKIYAIDSLTYKKLEAYIDLPDSLPKKQAYASNYNHKSKKKTSKKPSKHQHKEQKAIKVDLNTASETDLQQVKGIGAVFSKRIVKYRKALGGFVSKKQLLEVYGIDEELWGKIDNQLVLNTKAIEPLKINFASAKAIEKHPYFSKKLAKELVKNRSFKGRYKDINDLKTRLNLDTHLIHKIQDYIQF